MARRTEDQLIIKIGGNLEDLKKALAEGRVLIDNTSTSLGRMTASLRGDKLLAEAQKLVQGVEKAGGAAVLTAKEQAKVNAQLQDAITKYGLLGKAAPAAMLELEKATHGAAQKTSVFQDVIGKLGPMLAATFSVGAVMQFSRAVLEDADALVRLSDKTGMSIQGIQGLQFAAKQSGLELETVTSAVSMMQKRLAGGDDSATFALSKLGISFADFRDLLPDEQFKAIAQEVAKIEDPMQRVKVATDLFGKAGAEVLPLLIANVEALAAAAPKMSDASVLAFDRFGDASDAALARFKASVAEFFVGDALAGIYEGIDNIGAVLREDGSIDWGVAAGGTGGPLPRARPKTGRGYSYQPGIDKDPAWTSEIAKLNQLSDALIKPIKPAELLRVTMRGLNDDVIQWGEYAVDWEAQGQDLQNVLAGLTKEGLIPVSQTFNDIITELPEYVGGLDQAAKMTEDATRGTRTWRGELSSLAQAFRLLQQSSGEGGLGRFAQTLAVVTGSMDLGVSGTKTFTDGLYGLGEAGKTTSGRMGALASGALQMAAAMEQATQSTSHWENALSGAATGAAMGAQMSAGNPYATAAGGIIGLFYGYYKKTPGDDVTAKQKQALEAPYGGYRELARQAKLAGVSQAELNRIMAMGVDQLEDYQQAVDALTVAVNEYKKTIDAMKGAAAATKTIADSLGIASTQTQFERLGVYVSAIFGKMLRETGSLVEAFDAVGATLDKMIEAQDQFGFSGTTLLNELLPLRRILAGNEDLAGRISGLGQLGAALGPNLLKSMGVLPTFGADIADTFNQLAGRSGVSQQQALMLMQAPLQQLWEAVAMNGRNGMAGLDAETKRVLQLALDAGLVGSDMRSIGERQLDMLTNIRDLIAGTGPGGGGGGGGGGNGGGTEDRGWSREDPETWNTRNYPRFAGGSDGFQWFGSGTPALLHGWESVVTKDQAARAAAGGGSGGSGPVTVQFYEIHAVDADGFDQLMAKKGVPAFTKAVRTNAYKNNPELAATLRRLVDAG